MHVHKKRLTTKQYNALGALPFGIADKMRYLFYKTCIVYITNNTYTDGTHHTKRFKSAKQFHCVIVVPRRSTVALSQLQSWDECFMYINGFLLCYHR